MRQTSLALAAAILSAAILFGPIAIIGQKKKSTENWNNNRFYGYVYYHFARHIARIVIKQ